MTRLPDCQAEREHIIDWMPLLSIAEWAIIMAALAHANRDFGQRPEMQRIGALLQKLKEAIA